MTEQRKVTIIPADPKLQKKDVRSQHLRVAPYCRVSTDSDEQLSSYEAQIEYYTAKIDAKPEWTMVRLYADEGITGTSTKRRKFALSELLVCGECGSPYRRQTYMPRGEKYYVWRCLNRLENGRRVCKNSPTFTETDLQAAVVSAINEMFSQQRAKDAVRDSVAAALAAGAPKLSLPAIEGQLRAVQERQMELMQLAFDAGSENTSFDAELRKIYEAKAQLMMLKAEAEHIEQDATGYDERMGLVSGAIELDSGAIEEYDDIMVRQLISNIKVMDKETILVRFKDGTEIQQRIERTKGARVS